MYKRIISIFFISGLVIFSGCSSKNPDPDQLESQCTIGGKEAPRWVCGLHEDDNYYSAVGTAKVGKLGFGFAREEALADARANLAKKVEADVKARTTIFTRSTGVEEEETVERVVENVSKDVSHVVMNDTKQVTYWERPDTNEIYLLVKADKDKINGVVKKSIISSFKNDDALWQQFQSRKAIEDLENEFKTDNK